MIAKKLDPSTIRNSVNPLRAIYRHALATGQVGINPTIGLQLPAVDGTRDRIASPDEAAQLLDALPETERPLWATAFYGGLRRGELRALRARNIDIAVAIITVEHGWDDEVGEIDPKSRKGTRRAPIPSTLKKILAEHLARTGRRGEDLVFGRKPDEAFVPNTIRRHAEKAWASRFACGCSVADEGDAEPVIDKSGQRVCRMHRVRTLLPIGLHEARHTYVTLMHNAGVPLETIGDFAGHSSTYMADRYRHLLPGSEAEAARALDLYLERARSS
jgi:integrase